MEEVKMRPIRNGFIVSHYQSSKPKDKNSMPYGEYVESFHPDGKSAAEYMTEVAKKSRNKKRSMQTGQSLNPAMDH